MADNPTLDVLAIAAHRDDVEITCGGTVVKLADNGHRVGVLDLTRGEMGSKGTAEERERDALEATKIMGVAWRGNLNIPDAGVEETRENKLNIARVIRKFKPKLILLPYWEQRHPDHLATCNLGYDACFLAGLKKLDVEGEPHRPRKIIYTSSFRDVRHSFFVDVSEQFKRKLKCVAAYKSQFDGTPEANRIYKPGVNIFEFMTVTAQYYGHLVGVKYAEAFTIKENILIDDPLGMKVSSI